jgi:hypothetical protein
MSSGPMSVNARLNMAAGMKAAMADPAKRAQLAAARRARFEDPEYRARHRAACTVDTGLAPPRPPRVPEWVPQDLREDYRDFAVLYGEVCAAEKVRAMKREMERTD